MKEALVEIYNLFDKLYKDGYVITGNVELIKPPNRQVESDAVITLPTAKLPIGKIKVTTKRINPPKDQETVVTEIAKAQGFTGNTCVHCGLAMMVRQGTCEKCMSCGETSGCS